MFWLLVSSVLTYTAAASPSESPVERGYIIVVDDGQLGETVTVDMHTVRENVAFAEIVADDS